jgi:tetratricopeptide (TPR) repeat protein
MFSNKVHVAEEADHTAVFYEDAHAQMAKKAQSIIAQLAGKNKILLPEGGGQPAPNVGPATLKDAFNLYEQLLVLYPNHSYVWNGLGTAFYLKHDYQSALNCYKRANALSPDIELYLSSLDGARQTR